MTHAYSELYLSDAKSCLADMFDYIINDCKLKCDWAASLFLTTGYAQKFETGNPAILSGMSGVELGKAIVKKAYNKTDAPDANFREDRSPEYWAGWALAEYQWFSGRRFKDIFERIPLSQIIDMYSVYHEMDITQFIDTIEKFYTEIDVETKLKRIRESRGLSQANLASESGVHLRSIQMYEQKANDIDKAQAKTLYKISRVLGCTIEDLLEDPMN
jgi:DNA-binding XRE family transcriptional regulator